MYPVLSVKKIIIIKNEETKNKEIFGKIILMCMSGLFIFDCSKIYLKVACGEYSQFYSLHFPSFLALKP